MYRRLAGRRPRTRLTVDLQRQLADEIAAGASLRAAIARMELNPSTIYRWLGHAADGVGTRAEVALLEAVRAAQDSAARAAGPGATPGLASLVDRVARLERMFAQLERSAA